MSEHPLHFYKSLIENPSMIIHFKSKFFPDHEDEMCMDRNWEEEYFSLMNPMDEGPDVIIYYFKDHLEGKCQDARVLFCNNLDTLILNENGEKKNVAYLKKILLELDYLISENKKNELIQKYPSIMESLEAIKKHIVFRYGLSDDRANPYKTTATPKIKWLGNTNVLTTLFYDLIKGVKSEGISPLIEASSKEIEEFILNNFVDGNGEAFSQSTINTNLKPSRQEQKRAKGEVSIEIIKG